MSVHVPNVTLNNGVTMPSVGFGVFRIPGEETERVVSDALAAGYRHLDTAEMYGNEDAVGRAIAASGIPRDELFITTKLWVVHEGGQDGAKRAFAASLARLGLDYLDLYLIHQPFGDYYSSWRALQHLNADGSARAIGVSNFFPDRLADLIAHSEIVPAVNQIEAHPFNQRSGDLALAKQHEIQIEAWGPLAEGKNDIFTNPVLTAIANAHDKSVAQVALRWLLQRGISVIPKSVRPERMAENLGVFDFELTEDEMAQVAPLEVGQSVAFDHHDPEMVTKLGSMRLTN